MMKRALAIAVLGLTAVPVLASDVSYDQQQIRDGKVTLVEGSVSKKVSEARPVACSCARPNR